MSNRNNFYLPIILVSAVFFFIPFLGKVHLFDWDEINFAESAREMIVTGDYSRVMINFQPFWEKPPLFFWLQAACMYVFGVNEFAARFPNAVFGIISLLTLYIIGRRIIDERFGFIWALAYLGSFLPHLYFKSGIIDPVFNYFIFMGIYFLYKHIREEKSKTGNAAASGLFIGLANLTKGPVGLLIFLLCTGAFMLARRTGKITTIKSMALWALTFSLVSFFWFGAEVMQHGSWFLKEFFSYQVALLTTPVAGHQQPIYYHFVVVLLGCFPISVFALPVLVKTHLDKNNDFIKIMRILFWVVLILFTIVKTKIVHYSSLTYFPLSFLAALYIYNMVRYKETLPGTLYIMLLAIGSLFAILLTALPLAASHPGLIIPYIKDRFAVACLQLPVGWSGYEFITGLLYLGLVITLLLKLKKQVSFHAIVMLFYATAACLFIYLITVVPKIEAYSQGPAVNFYKGLAGKDVDAVSIGYYSYAQFYYFKKPGPSVFGSQKQEEDSLLNGNIKRPAYFITKITNTAFPNEHPDCKFIMNEGGYSFYKRMPGK